MDFIFLHADKHQSFCKMALWILIVVARHVQSTQNRKLLIFLQHFNKKNIDEVYVLLADKPESFLQVNTNICGCVLARSSQSTPNSSIWLEEKHAIKKVAILNHRKSADFLVKLV